MAKKLSHVQGEKIADLFNDMNVANMMIAVAVRDVEKTGEAEYLRVKISWGNRGYKAKQTLMDMGINPIGYSFTLTMVMS